MMPTLASIPSVWCIFPLPVSSVKSLLSHQPCIPIRISKQQLTYFFVPQLKLHFLEFYRNCITKYILFFVWLLSLSIIIFRCIHAVAIVYQFLCINSSFFFIFEWFSLARIDLFHPFNDPVDEFLGCLIFGTITDKTALKHLCTISL